MPVDRTLAHDLADALAALYRDVELRLAAGIASQLADGIEAPDWAQRKLAAVRQLERWVRQLLVRLNGPMADQVAQALILAYVRGGQAALDELARLQSTHAEWLRLAEVDNPGPRMVEMIGARAAGTAAQLAEVRSALPGAEALQRLMFSSVGKISGAHLRILRWADDVYRTTVTRASADVLLGTRTRRQAAQVAWDRLLSEGVTGFVDQSGRRWELASYVEMATRSATAQAMVEGHLDRLHAAGLDLVIVSDVQGECSKCRPFEGKVLHRNISGERTIQVPHAIRPSETVSVEIKGSVPEAVAAGLLHPNCFPAEVLVSAPSGVVAADARWYEGPLVVIHTASGDELPVTPNHPVLTPEGWIPAGQLHIGQRILRYRGGVQGTPLGAPDDQQIPASIGEVFDSLRQASTMPTVRVPVTAEHFHGDGFDADVDVVFADRKLRNGIRQQGGEGEFLGGGMGSHTLLPDRPALEVVNRAGHAAHGVVRGADLGGTLVCCHGRPFPSLGFTAGDSGAALENPAADARLADAEAGRQLVLALSGLVSTDEVVNLSGREAKCHVYNLQTRDGWYVANSLVVSNCRHSLSAYIPGVTKAPTHTEDPEGDKARTRLRYLERQVRKSKRLAEAAIDPAATKAHKAKARAYQAQIRDHVAATGLLRQPARERIGVAR